MYVCLEVVSEGALENVQTRLPCWSCVKWQWTFWCCVKTVSSCAHVAGKQETRLQRHQHRMLLVWGIAGMSQLQLESAGVHTLQTPILLEDRCCMLCAATSSTTHLCCHALAGAPCHLFRAHLAFSIWKMKPLKFRLASHTDFVQPGQITTGEGTFTCTSVLLNVKEQKGPTY